MAAASCGRSAEEIILLAITKTFPPELITQAVDSGLRRFGENRVQEAEKKILYFREVYSLEWHLVGHLQSNKVKRAVELFDVIHSIDTIRLAAKLNQTSLDSGKSLSILLQVDLGQEKTKSGAQLHQIRDIIVAASNYQGLRLDGLMTIPPFFEDPEETRPYFAQLRELRDSLESEMPGCLGQRHLSMGMSHDFEVAIQEGATIVRVGSAIFGERHYE